MKTVSKFFFLCALGASAIFPAALNATEIPPNSAFNCILNVETLIGQSVTVNVKNAELLSVAPYGNYVCFECETYFGGLYGGKIKALVPHWKAVDFFKSYYSPEPQNDKPVLKPLTARLVNYVWPNNTNEYVLMLAK